MSSGGRPSANRKTSRITRLARFRSTARRNTFLPTMSPSRGASAGPGRATSQRGGTESRVFGRSKTASKSRRNRIRRSRPKRRRRPSAAWSMSGLVVGGAISAPAAERGHRQRPLHRQPLAPLRSASVQHLSAALGRHPRSEPVAPLPLDHAWLVGSFHLRRGLAGARIQGNAAFAGYGPNGARRKGANCATTGLRCQRSQ